MSSEPLELRATSTDDASLAAIGDLEKVGLAGVTGGHRAHRSRPPGSAVSFGYRWGLRDQWDQRWWPQGIAVGEHDSRSLVLVSWYAQPKRGIEQGARISVLDLSDPRRVTYRHVLLVAARVTEAGGVLEPVLAHAGGIAWDGDRLLVAATFDGIREFRLSDLRRIADPARRPFGYELVLPQVAHHQAVEPSARGRLRYSFLSMETGTETGTETGADGASAARFPNTDLRLLAGEYGRDDGRRIARLTISGDRTVVAESHIPGVEQMQGVARHDGTWFISASNGVRPGDVWFGEPGSLVVRRAAVPPAPEDLAVWGSRDQLWSLSEIPGKRWVYAMDLRALV